MYTQPSIRKVLSIGLYLLLLLLPLQSVYGQEQPQEDGQGIAVEASSVTMEENVADEPVSEDQPAFENLTVRVFLPVIQGGNDQAVDEVAVQAAFIKSWSLWGCANVSANQYGLWDDMPGAGVNNESGLLWFINDQTLAEVCSYASAIAAPGLSTTSFPQLRYRVAVNDSARFSVSLYRFTTSGCTSFRSHTTPATNDDSAFRTYTVNIPTGSSLCRVIITLTDDPATVASSRSSALIDSVELRNPTTGAIGWQETFSN